MAKPKLKIGTGRFQWNFGGWFGSLFGGTAYLVVGGAAYLQWNPILGVIWISCFAVAAALAIYLWTQRASIAPYPAMQLLIAVYGLSGTIAIVSAICIAPKLLAAVQLDPPTSLGLLSMFPAMMLYFHFLETGARGKSTTN